jgi:urease accessory protein
MDSNNTCRFEDHGAYSSVEPAHEHSHSHSHGHSHDHSVNEHGHTHEQLDHPGHYHERDPSKYDKRDWSERAFTVGIGGYAFWSIVQCILSR